MSNTRSPLTVGRRLSSSHHSPEIETEEGAGGIYAMTLPFSSGEESDEEAGPPSIKIEVVSMPVPGGVKLKSSLKAPQESSPRPADANSLQRSHTRSSCSFAYLLSCASWRGVAWRVGLG